MKKQLLVTALATLLLALSFSVSAASHLKKANLITAGASASLAGKSEVVSQFSLEQLEQIVKEEGYGSVKIKGDNRVLFKSNGRTFVLNLYGDGDLQLYYGATGVKVSAEDINEWNRTKRLSRAYLDSDGDVALEADQFANGGLTREMVTELIRIFVNVSAPQYVEFIREHDQD